MHTALTTSTSYACLPCPTQTAAALDATVSRGLRAALAAYRHLFGAAPETSAWDELQAEWSTAVVAILKAIG
jgi:hypothetical protein